MSIGLSCLLAVVGHMINPKTRLAFIVLTFGLVLLGVGQSTVTLGIAIPFALRSLGEASTAMAAMALAGACGVAAFLFSMLFDVADRRWRLLSLLTIASLTCSVLVTLLVSERPRLSLFSSMPFAAATAFFAGRLQAR
jgi:hypothetical protein